MKLDTMEDLEKLLSVCRKNGVSSVKVDNVEFNIHPDHLTQPKAKKAKGSKSASTPSYSPGGITADTAIDTPDLLSPEDLLFYSATGQSEQ